MSSACAEQSEHTSKVNHLEMYSETARVWLDSVDKASCERTPCLSCEIMDAMTAVVSEVLSCQIPRSAGVVVRCETAVRVERSDTSV
jgi:hypothetical protein